MAGYIVSSYSSEQYRGRYIASLWGSVSVGSFVGAGTILLYERDDADH